MSARVAGSKNLSEDWLSVWIDLGVFALALGLLAGADLLGWRCAPRSGRMSRRRDR